MYDNLSQNCFDYGLQALTRPKFNAMVNVHLNYNYERYTATTTTKRHPDKEIFGLRTEHLWDGLTNLNVAFGGEVEDFVNITGTKNDVGSSNQVVKGDPSEDGMATLCCFLYKENEIYEDLMKQAVNLNQSAKEDALESLYRQCRIDKSHRLEGNFSWTEWAREQNCVVN